MLENRIGLRMRVKLSNELTDGLFSPRKNNRINLLDKQLQRNGGNCLDSSRGGTLLGDLKEKHFAKISKRKKGEKKIYNAHL